MTLVVKDRVKVTTTTTGTGTLTLGGAAVGGFQAFSVIGDGNTTYYTITDSGTSSWEVGIGTYTASGTTLSRDTVLDSSNSGSLVDFAAGTKDVFVAYPAERAVTGAMGYIENSSLITVSSTINAGNNAISGGPVTVDTGVSVTVPSGSRWTIV
jgi:outer membrane lipoprotein SlyB